jgi:hypothetical protein
MAILQRCSREHHVPEDRRDRDDRDDHHQRDAARLAMRVTAIRTKL